ncbi:hypothetical protein V6C03_14040 [Methyloligella sp. 2.7D]|uniref:hypothetical protein n=1 Tax=unclassified Methyloligella TaxID=2625955 RepID=UPI00157CC49B|nr:hypothetical protein [Methyloligella sp. GL2]QKP77121.1 hypothetical protein HT051_06425 [Methyloligella sp. GL2]
MEDAAAKRDALIAGIKREAGRRIEQAMPRWMIDREVSGGAAIPQAAKDEAAAIRARSDAIEAMDPLPEDFADDACWS